MIRPKNLLYLLPLLALLISAEADWQAKRAAASPHEHHNSPTLAVAHRLQGDDLHLQLTVSGFTFSLENMGKENRYGEGHVHLYLDGKKVAKIFGPQYVYRDVPSGRHDVMVELAHNNHDSYGIKQTFQIDIK
jgi:hypothetical protein